VERPRRLRKPARERAARAVVGARGAEIAREAGEEVALEACVGELGRDARATAAAALFGRGVRRRAAECGRGARGALEKARESLGERFVVRTLLGVA